MPKLMTFNIRNGNANDGHHAWKFRRELVAETVRRQDPDIVGFQEVLHHQLEDLLRDLPEYRFVGRAREDGDREGEYAPIFAKSSHQVLRSETFWLSDTPDVAGSRSWGTACTRICTVAQLDGLTVFNCHLDHVSQEARVRGLRLIVSRATAPAIIMGDFNVPEKDAVLDELEGWVDTFRAIHPTSPEPTTYHDFEPSVKQGEKIDYIYASPDLLVLSADVVAESYDGRPASDHFAVVANIEIIGIRSEVWQG